jgi:prolyl-tRNA editing enzyme YbaK/EbsC (Cys-tRNA(Pro) deacylase)
MMPEKSFGKMCTDILDLLKKKKMVFHYLVHKEASDSAQAEKETGFSCMEGIKSLILRKKKSGENILACLLGHQKIDMHLLGNICGESLEFEKKEVILGKYGLSVGGIPPLLATFFPMETYLEESILECPEVIFSCGHPTQSIRMKTDDLLLLIKPKIVSFAKLE